jgi:molybdopterin-guanine dinucleotide biosynthesis protein A
MGGGLKALEFLGGRPMLSHVIDRLAPQVDTLWLSVETASEKWSPFGLQQLPDPLPGSRGPLGGLLAALERAAAQAYDWLLLAPCDAPFLPLDLAGRLRGHAETTAATIVTVSRQGQLHPVFSLWRRDELACVEDAVRGQGMAGFRAFLDSRPHAVLEWNEGDQDPFFNVNHRTALECAEARLAESRGTES